jgi:hypothetical protein
MNLSRRRFLGVLLAFGVLLVGCVHSTSPKSESLQPEITSTEAKRIALDYIRTGTGRDWDAREPIRRSEGKEEWWEVEMFRSGDRAFASGLNVREVEVDVHSGKVSEKHQLYM